MSFDFICVVAVAIVRTAVAIAAEPAALAVVLIVGELAK
jgi:hypothetical protein